MQVWALLLLAAFVHGQNSEADEDSRGFRHPHRPFSPTGYRPASDYNNRPNQNHASKPMSNYGNKHSSVYEKEVVPSYLKKPAYPVKQSYISKEPYGYNNGRPYRPSTSYDDYSIAPQNQPYAIPQYPSFSPPYFAPSPFAPQASVLYAGKPEYSEETFFFDIFTGLVDKIKDFTNTTLSGLRPIIPILAGSPATTAEPALAQSTLQPTTESTTTERPRGTSTKKPKRKNKKNKLSPYQKPKVNIKPKSKHQYPMMMGASSYAAMPNRPTYSQAMPPTNMQPLYPGGYNTPQSYAMNQPPQNYPMNQSPQNYPMNQLSANSQRPSYNSLVGYQLPTYPAPQPTTYGQAQPNSMYQAPNPSYYSPPQRPASPMAGTSYSQNVYSQAMGDGSQYGQTSMSYPTIEITTPSYSYDAMQNNYSNAPYPAEGPANNGVPNYNY